MLSIQLKEEKPTGSFICTRGGLKSVWHAAWMADALSQSPLPRFPGAAQFAKKTHGFLGWNLNLGSPHSLKLENGHFDVNYGCSSKMD